MNDLDLLTQLQDATLAVERWVHAGAPAERRGHVYVRPGAVEVVVTQRVDADLVDCREVAPFATVVAARGPILAPLVRRVIQQLDVAVRHRRSRHLWERIREIYGIDELDAADDPLAAFHVWFAQRLDQHEATTYHAAARIVANASRSTTKEALHDRLLERSRRAAERAGRQR